MESPTKRCSRGDKCLNPLGCALPATCDYFPRNSRKADSLGSECHVCNRARVHQWNATHPKERTEKDNQANQLWRKREKAERVVKGPNTRRKIALVEHFGGRCQRCGYSKSPRALHFHHINPDARIDRGHVSYNEVEQFPERFMLVCANCHAEIHDTIDYAKRVTTHCLFCGREFVTQQRFLETGRARFCGRKCQSDARSTKATTFDSISIRFFKKTLRTETCWFWTGKILASLPVLLVRLDNGKYRQRSALKIAFRIRFGSDPEGELRHTCGNTKCVNPDHLILRR